MNKRLGGVPGCILLLILLTGTNAWACRFNVRDVGFVDFDRTRFMLYAFHDNTTPAEDVEAFHQIAFTALLDTNVELEMINVDEQHPDESVLQYLDPSHVSAWPHPVLVNMHDEAIPIEWANGNTFREQVWNTVEQITETPASATILEKCIEHYAVLLVVEGPDTSLNRKAHTAANQALQAVADNMENLPKEIRNPAVKVTIPFNQRDEERVLLWSIQVPPQSNTTHAAILYGRGRQIGDIFTGEAITFQKLDQILTVVGLSCECGLDRSWMMGTMMPLRWDQERQQLAADELGFDTESPLVKTEISQIMSIGQQVQRSAGQSGEVSLDAIVMGYREVSVGSEQNRSVDPDTVPRASLSNSQPTQSISVEETGTSVGLYLLGIVIGIVLMSVIGGAVYILRKGQQA